MGTLQQDALRKQPQEPKNVSKNTPVCLSEDDKVFKRMTDIMIPPAYQEYDLTTLKPDTHYCRTPVEFQQFVIDMVRAEPRKATRFSARQVAVRPRSNMHC
jgi:hypothetical protein